MAYKTAYFTINVTFIGECYHLFCFFLAFFFSENFEQYSM